MNTGLTSSCGRLLAMGLFLLLVEAGIAQDIESTPKLNADEEAVLQNAAAFVAAFNRADAKALSMMFTEDGEMTLDEVTVGTGREAIEKEYIKFFKENPGLEIAVHVDSMRQLGPNTIIERGVSEIINDDEESVVDHYTAIHVKKNGKWLTASSEVEQESIDTSYDWKADLEFLVGNWQAKQGDWSVATTFTWAAGGNFLKRDYKVMENGKVNDSGVQIIGWDPASMSITSWSFGSDGGHARATWQREGDQWVIALEATAPDGNKLVATNIVTLLNENTFRFQSTNRSLAGVALDDTEPLRVDRVTTKAPEIQKGSNQ